MARSKSSKRWLREHEDDEFVIKARAQGLRSRAAFKLEELQQRFRLVRPGAVVVDLGAAPGGWSQMAARWAGDSGTVVAMDLLEMPPLDGVTFIRGDFTEDEPLAALEQALADARADLVMSDMAPNISGMNAVDQPRAMYLAELALDFARNRLAAGGGLVVKVFQGEGFDELVKQAREDFSSVAVVKPKASRSRSREVYVVARGFRP